MSRRTLARYAAPAAFLAAATIAVLLVRAGLHGGREAERTATTPVPTRPAATAPGARPAGPRARYYRIRSGDTLDLVAARFGTTVERLLELNPGIEPTALRVGQRVRVR